MSSLSILVVCVLWSSSQSQKLVGGEVEVSKNDFYLLRGLDTAVMEENAKMKTAEKFVFLPDTIQATSQVVQGNIYRVQVSIAKSVCRNDEKHKLSRIDKCPVKSLAPGGVGESRCCRFVIWSRPWLKGNESMIVRNANCTRPVYGGVESLIDILKHPRLLQGLDIAMLQHNNEGIDGTGLLPANKFVYLPETVSGSVQGVQGKLYRVHVQIAPSICPNDDDHAYLRIDECSVQDINSPVIRQLLRKCEFEIWSRPWLSAASRLTVKKISCIPVPVIVPNSNKIQPIMSLKI